MNFYSPNDIKALLSRYGTKTSKRLGQNFLINSGVLKKIIEAANLDRGETVIEIGPGLGTLTQELAKYAKKVIAVEKDRKMVKILEEMLAGYKNVKIIEGDILKLKISDFLCHSELGSESKKRSRNKFGMTNAAGYKVVANLPYYITSPVIRKFLEAKNKPKEIILMVQKEVAQRICACPPDMSLLAVSVQFYAQPKIIDYVSKGSFWPPPKVDSAILKIVLYSKQSRFPFSERGIKGDLEKNKIHPLLRIKLRKGKATPPLRKEGIENFFKVVKAGFSAPRKQLAGNLAKKLKIERQIIEERLKETGIEPSRRAETLSVEEWKKLSCCLN